MNTTLVFVLSIIALIAAGTSWAAAVVAARRSAATLRLLEKYHELLAQYDERTAADADE